MLVGQAVAGQAQQRPPTHLMIGVSAHSWPDLARVGIARSRAETLIMHATSPPVASCLAAPGPAPPDLAERLVQLLGRSSPLVRVGDYTSREFATTIAELGMRQSVGRTGICYDNAMSESFFAALKNERVHRTAYPTRAHARTDIARYIEFWYNTTRLHSGLDYKSSQEILNEWIEGQRAA